MDHTTKPKNPRARVGLTSGHPGQNSHHLPQESLHLPSFLRLSRLSYKPTAGIAMSRTTILALVLDAAPRWKSQAHPEVTSREGVVWEADCLNKKNVPSLSAWDASAALPQNCQTYEADAKAEVPDCKRHRSNPPNGY